MPGTWLPLLAYYLHTQKIDGYDHAAPPSWLESNWRRIRITRRLRVWRLLAKIHARGRFYDFDASYNNQRPSAPSRYQSGHADGAAALMMDRGGETSWRLCETSRFGVDTVNGIRGRPYMTSAKFSGFWTSSPLVRIWDWSTVLNSSNLPYYIFF